MKINDMIIAEAKRELLKAKIIVLFPLLRCNINEDDFMAIFKINCQKEMYLKGIDKEFVVDENNIKLISNLYYYITGNKLFSGSLNKGIMIQGNIGTGKTLIMKGFISTVLQLTNKVILSYNALSLNRRIIYDGYDLYIKCLLLIDDLGKEPEVVNNYGTSVRPIMDLLALRYDANVLTFATSNYKLSTLSEKYGEQTVDRMREMFNFFELLGKSRR